ncbi:MAG: hypothetical protein PHY92_04605 [Alphaproteobacteria bacterium]|nr:hypothetical protein [Alphaproteobacteria bacterium]
MTDDQEELETGPAVQEEQDPNADAWHEELPPEDDFHDQPESATSMTEEMESETDPFEGGAPAKKSGTKVMLGVIAVFALFAGAMLYLQFGKDSQTKGGAPVPAAALEANNEAVQKKTDRQIAPGSASLEPPPASLTSSEADITAIYNAGLAKTTVPVASTVAIPGNAEPKLEDKKPVEPEAKTSEVMTVNALTPPIAAGVGAPSALSGTVPAARQEPAKTSSGTGAEPATSSGLQPLAPSSSQTDLAGQNQSVELSKSPQQAVVESQLNELAAQIDDIRKALQQTSQQTNQLVSRLESGQLSSSGANNEALNNRLDKIERQLSDLSRKKAAKTEESATLQKGGEAGDQTGISANSSVETPPKTVRKTTRPKAKKAGSVHKSAETKQKGGTWVLRAATPDSAWVSESAASTELRHVQVGDTLPGIGKVVAVRQTGDGWTVVGSKGTIR